MIRGNDAERFMSKVSPCPITGCWWYVGACDRDGYGKFQTGPNRGQRHWRAHRFAMLLDGVNVENDLVTRHLCNNGHLGCVNPSHLRLGTQAENRADTTRRVTHCKRGHEFDDANTYRWRTHRICRRCHALRAMESRRLTNRRESIDVG